MGILDDAIRQHLDLKRRQGADVNELQRLEDEAFGPPARPGDPDFPADAEAGSSAGPDTATAEPDLSLAGPAVEEDAPEPPGLFDVESAEPVAEAPAIEESAPEEAAVGEDFDLGEIDLDLDDELESLEPGEPVGPEQPVEPEQAFEPEQLAGPEAGSGAVEAPAEPVPEPPPAEPPPAEPPIESLDTVEHQLDEEEAVEEAPPGEDPGDEPAPEPEVDEPEAPAEQAEGEDVLEETPEFLRDRPEDDELWFEQGRPKDFDF